MEYLVHHGIKGQKWGVRHGPPYPLRKTGGPLKTFAEKVKRNQEATKAFSKEVEVRNRISKNKNIDKESGLHLKDREFSRKEDLSQVNPGFKNFSSETKRNCVNCSVTYDLRRRGYDVTAKESKEKNLLEIRDVYKGVTVSSFNFFKNYSDYGWDTEGIKKHAEDSDRFIKQMEKEPDSRGIISIKWSGSDSGHAMSYEVNNGKFEMLDGQSNQIRNREEILALSYNYITIRTDNLELNKKGLKKVCT